jgi:hypothetical protein
MIFVIGMLVLGIVMGDTDNALGNQESVGGNAHGRIVMTYHVICAPRNAPTTSHV